MDGSEPVQKHERNRRSAARNGAKIDGNNLRRFVIQAVTLIVNLYFILFYFFFFRTWDLVYDLTDQALAVLRPEKSQRLDSRRWW